MWEDGSHIRKVCGKVGVTLGRCVGRWESHSEGVWEGGSHIRKVCGKMGVTWGRCMRRWESH